jgi:hypothetical protein
MLEFILHHALWQKTLVEEFLIRQLCLGHHFSSESVVFDVRARVTKTEIKQKKLALDNLGYEKTNKSLIIIYY